MSKQLEARSVNTLCANSLFAKFPSLRHIKRHHYAKCEAFTALKLALQGKVKDVGNGKSKGNPSKETAIGEICAFRELTFPSL